MPQSFDDHYSQATLFWNSLTEPERDHIVGAFSFELGKVASMEVVERTLANLANVDAELCEKVAAHLGQPAPKGTPTDAGTSPALSMAPAEPGPLTGRVVGILADDGVDAGVVTALDGALDDLGATLMVIAPHGGKIAGSLPVDKTLHTCDSVEFDAVVLAGSDASGSAAIAGDRKTGAFLQEAFRHHKTIGAWGSALDVLADHGVTPDAPGVVATQTGGVDFATKLVAALGWHRHWDRVI